MPSTSAASMFGGAGGRGARASVASLEGLRNVLRNNESERDSASIRAAGGGPVTTPVTAPADDKQTLRALNDRLSGYLGRVKQLEKENQQLKEEIKEIWGKRRTAEGRDWGALEKPLNHLKNKIKEVTMHNAKLLLQIDNTKLANADFTNKLNDETKARKAIGNDLDDLKKNIEDTELSNRQTQKEIHLVKDELVIFEQDHKNVVDDLREKIKNSEINVEIETPNSNLPEIVNNIRKQYDKVATKNLKETEDRYQSKFENIKVEEAHNAQALQSGKLELKDLLQQKQHLEVKVQGARSTIFNLEESLRFTKLENGRRLGPFNRTILDLEQQLRKMRAHVESKLEMNKDLLCVKMKLESEIDNYQQLMSDNFDRADFSFDHGLAHDQQKPDGEEHEVMKEENEGAPSEAPQIKEEVWTEPTDDLAVRKNAQITKSSSSESEEEKAKNQGEEEKA